MGKKRGKKKVHLSIYILIFLLLLNVALGMLGIAKSRGLLIPQQPELTIVDNTINLNQLSLEQKIAQMVVVLGVQY
ncbi:MAG: hypothetical protein KJ771_02490, partial [Nanoarchaeota archaeon]|nr:hypothetical protein [Nanoarchaeota archaeon]